MSALRLLSYNIRHGGVGRENALVETIRACSPDLVVFQEATRPAVIERLAHETGMATWAARPDESAGFMGRVEVSACRWRRPAGWPRGFLEIVLAGSVLRVVGIHLTAVHSNWTERLRAHELSGILDYLANVDPRTTVIAGDFNTLAPGELLDPRRLPRRYRLMAWLGGREIRWRTIHLMLAAGYVDGYRRLRGSDPGYTFPTWDPHVRLDYVFLPEAHVGALTSCRVVDDAPGVVGASDHFPLLAELTLP